MGDKGVQSLARCPPRGTAAPACADFFPPLKSYLSRGGMTGETHRTPIRSWPREMVRATVLAYRAALGDGGLGPEAFQAAREAFIAAGGEPDRAPHDIPLMVSAAARDHGEWFWRPARERVDREERFWRSRGIWPLPLDRRAWPPIPRD